MSTSATTSFTTLDMDTLLKGIQQKVEELKSNTAPCSSSFVSSSVSPLEKPSLGTEHYNNSDESGEDKDKSIFSPSSTSIPSIPSKSAFHSFYHDKKMFTFSCCYRQFSSLWKIYLTWWLVCLFLFWIVPYIFSISSWTFQKWILISTAFLGVSIFFHFLLTWYS